MTQHNTNTFIVVSYYKFNLLSKALYLLYRETREKLVLWGREATQAPLVLLENKACPVLLVGKVPR